MNRGMHRLALASLLLALTVRPSSADTPRPVPDLLSGPAEAVIDLRTSEGSKAARAVWRYAPARLVDANFRAPGPELKPTGPVVRTLDLAPKAGATELADERWEVLDPAALEARRGDGKLSFAWYRVDLALPERVGGVDVTGASVVFEIVVDDYAEVWVNGRLPRLLGSAGGALVSGFNAPNRVVLTTDARPGQLFHVAVLAANGPLSDPPSNYIWIRSATLDFYSATKLRETAVVVGRVLRLDPALDAVVSPGAAIERVATGFGFTEGPVWHPEGYLLFSDPNENRIWRFAPEGTLAVYRTKSGYSGANIAEYHQPGSNGLALDGAGGLVVCEHGNRRVVRIEKNGSTTVLAERFEGKRLNSPNDVTLRSDGWAYFTDPPFGLPRVFDDARKELPFSGVYRAKDGRVELLNKELSGPNGIAFSPDERFLYVSNWDPARKVVMKYELLPDGTLGPGALFFDAKDSAGEEALDGVKVDALGNVYVSAPGGVAILSPQGRRLGTLDLPELPANFAFGGDDGRTLYMTARSGLYRVQLNVAGGRAAR